MRKQLMAGCFLASLVLVLGSVAPAVAQATWTGAGADNLWSNQDNWDGFFVPEIFDRVFVDGPAATAPNGPVIEDGIDAKAETLVGESGISSMTMTGGSLELGGWGMWWGDSGSVTATFNMSGGEINFTGSPGVWEMAWQDDADPPGGSHAVWNMTDGVVNALGTQWPASGDLGATATVNLDGGTINVGTSRDGLKMQIGGLVDITEGQIILEGEQSQVDDYIASGWIVAYGGDGELVDEFDGAFRTLSATIALDNADFNDDGIVDGDDFLIWQGGFGSPGDPSMGDANGDGNVDGDDFLIWQDQFGGPPPGGAAGAVPEPTSLLLLLLVIGGVLTKRRH